MIKATADSTLNDSPGVIASRHRISLPFKFTNCNFGSLEIWSPIKKYIQGLCMQILENLLLFTSLLPS